MKHGYQFRPMVASCALALGCMMGAAHAESSLVRFGVQPWPGVTVKSEVAAQLLRALGYETKQTQLNTPLTLNGLANGDLEVGLGGWYPISQSMIDPMVKDGKINRLAPNLSGALSGMAVPAYVHEAGVNSVDDLNAQAARFGSEVYGIESGSTWNTGVQEAMESNRHDLGDWSLVASSTAAMLAQVGRAIKREDWIVFYGWKPHWMNIAYDLYYLEAPADSRIAHTKATVYTLVAPDFPKSQPNLARFFRQYKVTPEIQSRWVYAHEYNKRPPDEVAREWIAANLQTVREWVKNLKTADDEPAFQAVQAEYSE